MRMLAKTLKAATFVLFASATSAAEIPHICSQISELECLQSTTCELEQVSVHGKYIYREAKNRCEMGFRQSGDEDIKKVCGSKPGCKFKFAECFCPPNVLCECGGGPPAQCVETQ
jgi:hypothetical protein